MITEKTMTLKSLSRSERLNDQWSDLWNSHDEWYSVWEGTDENGEAIICYVRKVQKRSEWEEKKID